MKITTRWMSAGLLLAGCIPALAHVVLEEPAAPAGSSYRAVFRVAHGCDGRPTTAIRVLLPEGFRGAKPMPKPGWTLSTRRATLAQPYVSHGKTITQDVVEISWTAAGPEQALPDDWYDEFILRGTAPQTPGATWFRVLQSCTQGQIDWAQMPATGTSTRGLKAPAVLLDVQPADPAAHTH